MDARSGNEQLCAELGTAVRPWPEVPAVVVAVRARGRARDSSWSPDGTVSPHAAFRTASVTKTFTAAALLRLVEQGALSLDTPVPTAVSERVVPLLPRLFTDPGAVTLRHLLQHTSGAADYAQDPRWSQTVVLEPDRQHEAIDMLSWSAEHQVPLGPPGSASRYSDTGYVVAADILSRTTALPYAEALRSLLDFGSLGMRDTWMERREPAPEPAPPFAPSNVMGHDLWSIHPSYDTVGGGGLVSTAADLTRFFAALLGGRLIGSNMLREMQSTVPCDVDGDAGLGLFRRDTPLGRAWGHTGFHGAFAYVVPERNLVVAGSVCSQEAAYDEAGPRPAVLEAVARHVHDW